MAKAQNITFETLYGGQFVSSTQLVNTKFPCNSISLFLCPEAIEWILAHYMLLQALHFNPLTLRVF